MYLSLLRRFGLGIGLILAAARAAAAQDSLHVVVVSTTDIHGRVTAWDYVADREAPWGLDRAATVIDSLRKAYPGQVVVVDAGDLIQGEPFAAYFASVRPADPNPVVDALNAVGYDAWTPGNHEFNFGLEALARATGSAGFPVVSGNIFALPRDMLAYQSSAVVRRGAVRVGITGFTTPGVMRWDAHNVAGRVLVRPILPQAERVLRDLDARVDLKLVLIHSGMDGPASYDTTGIGDENVAARLATLQVKPDLVVVGHSHRRMRDSVIAGVHFVQPDPWAQSLSVAHVWLTPRARPGAEGARYRVSRIEADVIPLAGVRRDPTVTARFARAKTAVQSWVSEPLTVVEGDWSARNARAEDTPLIDFINDVQRRHTGAQLSSTAAFDTRAGFGPGVVRLRDVAGVYPYENTLTSIRIPGGALKAYLEQSAAYFHTWRPGEPIINDSIPGYNYDIVSGVSYTVDVSRPLGSRILQLTYQGRLVEPSDTFTLALNSYRQGGGGGFRMLAGLPVVYDRGENVRDVIAEALRKIDTLRAKDYTDQSWRLSPPAAAAAVRAQFGPPVVAARDSLLLRVFYLNDLHGALEPRITSWSQGKRVGGVAAIKGLMDSLGAQCRCPTLRLDGGDEMQGSPASNWVYGKSIVEAMNAMGIAAAAVGNHEYDWGLDTLQARMQDARYPWLSANTIETRTGKPPAWATPWTVLEVGGKRVGLIGITTITTPTSARPSIVAPFNFEKAALAIRRALPDVRSNRPDFVFVLAHEGGFCDSTCHGEIFDAARTLDSGSVDLIAAGHTHVPFNTTVKGIPIVDAGAFGGGLAVVDFWRRANGARETQARVLTVWTDSIRADPALAALVERYRRQTDQVAARPVAEFKFPLEKRDGDYPLGHLIADAQRVLARTDVAIMNNGGIRTRIPAGSVTYGQLFELQPFGNLVVKLTVRGDSLLRAFETVVAGDQPDANVSGVEIWYDPSKPNGSRVKRAKLSDGKQVTKNGTYTLAVSDFMAEGGSGFSMLRGAPKEETGSTDLAALVSYLGRLPRPVEVPETARLHPEK